MEVKMKEYIVVFTMLLLAYGQHSHAVKTKSESASLPAQALNNEDEEVNSPKMTHETASPRDRGQEEEVCGISESHPSVQEGECQANGNDTVDLAQHFKGLRMDDHAEQSTKEKEGGGAEARGDNSVSERIDEIRDHGAMTIRVTPDQEDSEMVQEALDTTVVDKTEATAIGTSQTQDTDSDICHKFSKLEVSGSRPQENTLGSFRIHRILGDGNCFFRAVADQLNHRDLPLRGVDHIDLREMACTYLSNLSEEDKNKDWGGFLVGGSLQNYILNMRRVKTYAENIIIQALAERLSLHIVIHYTNGYVHHIKPRSGNGDFPKIHLLYTQFGRNESPLDHYDSLHENTDERQTSSQTNNIQELEMESHDIVEAYGDQPLVNPEKSQNKREQEAPYKKDPDMLSDSKLPTQVAQNSDSKSDSAATTHAETKSYFKIDSVKRGTDFMNHKTQDHTRRVKNSGKVLPPRDIDSQKVLPPQRRDSTKVLPPTKRDKVDGVSLEDLKHEEDLEDTSTKAKSSNVHALPGYHRLLSHYKDVKKLSHEEDFLAVLRDRDCPIHIAILRRRLFNTFEYFHHLLISEVFSDTVGRLCIRVIQMGILTLREMYNSTYLVSVHESEYIVLENGRIPNNTLRNFTFDQGVFLIKDFTPHSESELREVRRRISECKLKLPYCPSLFNCETFVLYVLTGRDDIKSQIDIMNFAEIGLGHFFDYLIPWNMNELLIIFIIIIMACVFFPVSLYDLLSSFIFVPLSKLRSHTKLEKILPSDRFNCNILHHVLVMLMIYFYFLKTCVDASLLYVIPFYFSIALSSALVGISLNFLRNFLGIDHISYVFQGFCEIGKKFSSGVSYMKKTIVNKMEKKIEESQESGYFVATWILIKILFTIKLFFDRE